MAALALAVSMLAAAQSSAPISQFTFVSWGDTKDGRDVLGSQARQIKSMRPDLTLYCGDLVSRFSIDNVNRWKRSMNAGVGLDLLARTFVVRGNHDKGDDAGWRAAFDFGRTASGIGGSNYRALPDGLTYSFDYANAHVVGVDVPGDVTDMTDRQLGWLDDDLGAAERRGLAHAFVFWHGPLYPVGGHCCSAGRPEFVALANRHPILSATFHGHEHQLAWVHIDRTRYPQASGGFEEFVTGASGADTYECKVGRSDFCRKAAGFAFVSVSGNTFTVNFFIDGKAEPAWTKTFTKAPPKTTQ